MLSCTYVNYAWAESREDKARQHDSEYISGDPVNTPQLQWTIIGTHTGNAVGSEKFIKPTNECILTDIKDVDYLLQLELCKETRKGWLKI